MSAPRILLAVSPNYSLKMLQEEVILLQRGAGDFRRSVDWRISAPLGLLYIAGALRKAGYETQIYDLHRAFFKCREDSYFEGNSLDDFFDAHFANVLRDNPVDVLGISCLFNVSVSSALKMARICRKVSPRTKVVMGGHYPTARYQELLVQGDCDYVILGEAEETMVWLMAHLDPRYSGDVLAHPNIVSCTDTAAPGKYAAVVPELDSLAEPAWDLLPHVSEYIEDTLHAGRVGSGQDQLVRAAGILTTRGCPMRCTFCAARGVHGTKVRSHSVEYMMCHLDRLVADYAVNRLLIEDDMFNYNTKRAADFARSLSQRYGKLFSLEFPNGLAIWNLYDTTVKCLKEAGMDTVTVGIESGNPHVQKHILRKNLNLQLVKEKVALLKRHRVVVRAFFILGFVGETLEMMRDTIDFAMALNIDWSEFKVFTPLAGSEMYHTALQSGYLIGDTSEHVYGRCAVRTPDFTPRQVEEMRYDANIRVNFLNNRRLKDGEFGAAYEVFAGLLNVFPNHLFAAWGCWQSQVGLNNTAEAAAALGKLKSLTRNSPRNRALLKKYGIVLPRLNKTATPQ